MKFHAYLILVIILRSSLSYGQGIIISNGAEMTISGNPYIIIRDGGIINEGTYTKATEELQLTGTLQDSINAEYLNFYRLTILNEGGIKTNADTLVSNYLGIDAASSFTITPARFVTVISTLTNNAGVSGLILKADNTGSGSLISSTIGVPATVEFYMTGNRWHIVSSPAPGQTCVSFLANNDSIPHAPTFRAMTYYDEAASGWAGYLTDASPGTMEAGEGYLVRTSKDTVIYFEGNLQNFIIPSFPISNTVKGWHSVGNPFSSSIRVSENADPVNNFLSENSTELDPEYVALYIWDEQPGYQGKNRNDYVALNLLSDTTHIRSGQGFLVKAKTGGGDLSFSTTTRQHYNQTVFNKKSLQVKPGRIKLYASDSENTALTQFYFKFGTTPGLDPGYDAGLFGALKDFSLYSQLVEGTETRFMIQALSPDFFNGYSIPVGLEVKNSSNVIFRAESSFIPDQVSVILEDRELGLHTDLKTPGSVYEVNLPEGSSGTGRFFLHCKDTGTQGSDSEVSDRPLNIYERNRILYIRGEISGQAEIRLYDISGRLVLSDDLPSEYENNIALPSLVSGIYLVKISDISGDKVKRVFIK